VTAPAPTTATRELSLRIEGMTCAACAARVEKRLNRMDGVAASVNFATERAQVVLPEGTTTDDVLAAVAAAGYRAVVPQPGPPAVALDDEADRQRARALHRRLFASAVLGLPVVLLAMIPALQFRHWQWVSFALTLPIAVWGAAPFHRAAWAAGRHGSATMDTLVSLGVVAAFGWSCWALFVGDAGRAGMTMGVDLLPDRHAGTDELYLEVAAVLTVLVLAGRALEQRARRRTGAALRALLALGAREATVLDGDGRERPVPIDELAVGDRFVVRPGEQVATDGVVEEGTSAVDASLLTGESAPVEVGPGDAVTGATVNAGGRLVVRATRVGADTQLARIGRLVEAAQTGKAQIQRLADRVAGVFVPGVLLLSAGTLGYWLGAGEPAGFAATAAVAVLVIACPCALGLATPTALLAGTGRGAQLGLLIRGPEVLESTRRVDTVVLDKTGTVTTGKMALVAVHPAPGVAEDDALRLVGAVEQASEHPVGRAIAAAADDRLGRLPPVDRFASHRGLGVEGTVDGTRVVAGRPAFVGERIGPLPGGLAGIADAEAGAGRTVVAAAWDGRVQVVLAVADAVRETSAAAVADLRTLGLRPVLLTGDNERVAATVAAQVGIDDVVAGVLPEEKVDVVRRLQDDGRVVAMVGDGVNDAAALAAADLGLAMGTGTDAAIEASDLTLVGGDLRAAADAIRLSRRTLGTIRGNLFWAFAYNVAALPLAAAGYLNPMIAGAAMAASSVFVVGNSLRLRRFTPGP
jgi:Cu+-exporting ATPase